MPHIMTFMTLRKKKIYEIIENPSGRVLLFHSYIKTRQIPLKHSILIKLKSKMFSSLSKVLNCGTDVIELLKLYLFKVLTRIEVLYCLYLVLMSKMFS